MWFGLVHQLVYCYRPTEGAGLTLTNSPTLTPIEGTSICSLKKDGGKKNLKHKDSWFVVIGGWEVLPHGCGAVSSVTQPAELSLSLDALLQTQKPASKVNLRWWCRSRKAPRCHLLTVCGANAPLAQRKCKMWPVLFNVTKKIRGGIRLILYYNISILQE